MASPIRVNALDRLIGIFDPSRGLRRVRDRTLLQRAYEAASPRDPWRPRRSGASAQADHMADAATLRAKARSLVQNVPYISTSMDALVANVIGTGIAPRFIGKHADVLNAVFAEFVTVCDADGRQDFYGIQSAAYRAMEVDGEVLVRLRPRRPGDGLPVPLQLQLLEIDWLDSSRNSGAGNNNGAPPNNTIVQGIEYDPIGRVAAYWLWDQHPGDATMWRSTRNFSKRVDARNIIHLFDPKRPGQGRGITRLAPIIARTRDTQLYEDSELARKNLESRLSVLVSGDASLMANEFQQGSTDAAGQADASLARRTGNLGELASGSITEIPAGNTVTTVEPKPAGGHVEYIKHQLHIISAALGVTYEMATGDMTEVNFSSARVRGIDVRRGFEHTQWMVIIPRLVRAVADAFVQAAIDGGRVPEGARYGVEYDTPKWDYVNPQQEVNADATQIANGLSTISAKLRARGENPERVFSEMQTDFERLSEMKVGGSGSSVLDILFFLQKGKTADAMAPTGDAGAAQRAADQRRGVELLERLEPFARLLERHDAQSVVRALDGVMRSQSEPPAPPSAPVVNITNNIPERSVTVQPSAAMVEVRNEGATIHVPAAEPVVNVTAQAAPAEVRVVNEVQPAAVQVNLPARKSDTEIIRDASGRIVRSVTSESDIGQAAPAASSDPA